MVNTVLKTIVRTEILRHMPESLCLQVNWKVFGMALHGTPPPPSRFHGRHLDSGTFPSILLMVSNGVKRGVERGGKRGGKYHSERTRFGRDLSG